MLSTLRFCIIHLALPFLSFPFLYQGDAQVHVKQDQPDLPLGFRTSAWRANMLDVQAQQTEPAWREETDRIANPLVPGGVKFEIWLNSHYFTHLLPLLIFRLVSVQPKTCHPAAHIARNNPHTTPVAWMSVETHR